jgi:hypothetical protein
LDLAVALLVRIQDGADQVFRHIGVAIMVIHANLPAKPNSLLISPDVLDAVLTLRQMLVETTLLFSGQFTIEIVHKKINKFSASHDKPHLWKSIRERIDMAPCVIGSEQLEHPAERHGQVAAAAIGMADPKQQIPLPKQDSIGRNQ